MKVKIRVFGLTPHDDGEADAITLEFDRRDEFFATRTQYDLQAVDTVIHKESCDKGSPAYIIAGVMRMALESDGVSDVTMEKINISYKPDDRLSYYAIDPAHVVSPPKLTTPLQELKGVQTVFGPLTTDKQIYNLYLSGKISTDECNYLLNKVDREGNAEAFRKQHPEFD